MLMKNEEIARKSQVVPSAPSLDPPHNDDIFDPNPVSSSTKARATKHDINESQKEFGSFNRPLHDPPKSYKRGFRDILFAFLFLIDVAFMIVVTVQYSQGLSNFLEIAWPFLVIVAVSFGLSVTSLLIMLRIPGEEIVIYYINSCRCKILCEGF
jgi:hypothetical protein